MIRTVVRSLFWVAIMLVALFAVSAVAAKAEGAPLIALLTAAVLWAVTAAVLRRRTPLSR
jgi:hypothetical protein